MWDAMRLKMEPAQARDMIREEQDRFPIGGAAGGEAGGAPPRGGLVGGENGAMARGRGGGREELWVKREPLRRILRAGFGDEDQGLNLDFTGMIRQA
jgi:hypothetical protein